MNQPCVCGCGDFYHIERVEAASTEYSNTLMPLGLTGFYGETEKKGLMGGTVKAMETVEMQAYVCRQCHRVHFFARNPELLEKMVAVGKAKKVRVAS